MGAGEGRGDAPDPSRCRWSGAAPAETGYQRHHLIPVALLQRPQMAAMFAQLHGEGFALHRFELNGLLLPAKERLALVSGHALHRGPHQAYSDVVAARVEQIHAHHALQAAREPAAAGRVAAARLRLLQTVLRQSLTDRHGMAFWLNRRDPMRLFADRPYLDDAIDRLFSG
jgi:hypothetical protein